MVLCLRAGVGACVTAEPRIISCADLRLVLVSCCRPPGPEFICLLRVSASFCSPLSSWPEKIMEWAHRVANLIFGPKSSSASKQAVICTSSKLRALTTRTYALWYFSSRFVCMGCRFSSLRRVTSDIDLLLAVLLFCAAGTSKPLGITPTGLAGPRST